MMEKLSVNIFEENYSRIKEEIALAAEKSGKAAEDIILLAATKTVDADVINHAIKSGIEYIGENRVQELKAKNDFYLPVHKHFIGHLQTNKVKDVIDKVELIQSVDSVKLANEISRLAENRGKVMDILLEINIGNEESKSGFCEEEALDAVYEISSLKGVKIKGLMAIPPICEDEKILRGYFYKMHKLFVDIGAKKIDNSSMDILSMGMSEDFSQAIEEGANLVRIGTALFGRRNYNI
ncbi:MAG: YggS family pyridoxal phosphate-dependent enzyme [Clostridia bacterium]|nr:YggS family pyridoxal phosphate-dependent enzyme [Clostridia bacterium]